MSRRFTARLRRRRGRRRQRRRRRRRCRGAQRRAHGAGRRRPDDRRRDAVAAFPIDGCLSSRGEWVVGGVWRELFAECDRLGGYIGPINDYRSLHVVAIDPEIMKIAVVNLVQQAGVDAAALHLRRERGGRERHGQGRRRAQQEPAHAADRQGDHRLLRRRRHRGRRRRAVREGRRGDRRPAAGHDGVPHAGRGHAAPARLRARPSRELRARRVQGHAA